MSNPNEGFKSAVVFSHVVKHRGLNNIMSMNMDERTTSIGESIVLNFYFTVISMESLAEGVGRSVNVCNSFSLNVANHNISC